MYICFQYIRLDLKSNPETLPKSAVSFLCPSSRSHPAICFTVSLFFLNFSSFILCSNIARSRHFIPIIIYFSSVLPEYVYKKRTKNRSNFNYSNFNYFYYLIISSNTRTNDRPKFNYCFILFCFKTFMLEKITLCQKGRFSLDTAVILTTFTLRQFFFIIFKSDD